MDFLMKLETGFPRKKSPRRFNTARWNIYSLIIGAAALLAYHHFLYDGYWDFRSPAARESLFHFSVPFLLAYLLPFFLLYLKRPLRRLLNKF